MSKGPLGIRFGAVARARTGSGRGRADRGRRREHGQRRVARRRLPLVPLARLARQPDRLGRHAHDRRRALAPGERATVELAVRGPIPPGPYRLALDAVAEHRAWFSELGSEMLRIDVEVAPRPGEPSATLPPWVEATPAWDEHMRAAHAEGYAVVAGSIDWEGGALRRRPRALEPYAPGTGRVPGVRRAAPLPVRPAGDRARAARRRRRPAGVRRAA